jgi:hypothetical protein
MKYLIVMLMLLVVGIRAEAAHIPVVPQCQVLATHADVAECFGVLNATHKPDTTKCGPLDLPSIMRSVDANNSSLIGSTWRRLGALVLDQCGYSAEAKDAFLGLETALFGGPEPREQATRAWRRQVCIKADRDKLDELTTDQRAQLYLSFIGDTYFGGGAGGVKKADEHLKSLVAARKQADLDKLGMEFLEHRIKPCL